jgi:hypothetical protein
MYTQTIIWLLRRLKATPLVASCCSPSLAWPSNILMRPLSAGEGKRRRWQVTGRGGARVEVDVEAEAIAEMERFPWLWLPRAMGVEVKGSSFTGISAACRPAPASPSSAASS